MLIAIRRSLPSLRDSKTVGPILSNMVSELSLSVAGYKNADHGLISAAAKQDAWFVNIETQLAKAVGALGTIAISELIN